MTEKPTGPYILVLFILSLAGIALSAYSVYEHVSLAVGLDTHSPLCTMSEAFNCQKILSSKYSTILGIPLGSYGLLFYVVILGLVLLLCARELANRRIVINAVLSASLIATVYSIILFYISKFVLRAICPICLGTYIVNVALLIISWLAYRDAGFFSRIGDGIRALCSYVLMLFGVSSQSRASIGLARFSLLGLILAAFSAHALPEYLLSKFTYEQLARQEALGVWMREELTPIDVSNSGAFGDYSKGPESAPIQIIEFSDYECPACRATHEILEKVLSEYDSTVRLTLKNFPLDNSCNRLVPQPFHLQACFAAHLARCAGEQDRFWEMSKFLFETDLLEIRDNLEATRTEILARSDSLGLDVEALRDCMASNRQMERVKADIEQGHSAGVEGTPSFWINGRRFVAISETGFRAVFDSILKKE